MCKKVYGHGIIFHYNSLQMWYTDYVFIPFLQLIFTDNSKGAAQSWQMDNRYETMIDDKFEFGFTLHVNSKRIYLYVVN